MAILNSVDLAGACPRAIPLAGKTALVVPQQGISVSYEMLDRRTAALASEMAVSGLNPGDTLAVMSTNRLEFVELAWAALRAGLYLVPMSGTLSAVEAHHILTNSSAAGIAVAGDVGSMLLDDPATKELVKSMKFRVCFDGAYDTFDSYDRVVNAETYSETIDRQMGSLLLYSGGSTGKPKGIRRPLPQLAFGEHWLVPALWAQLFELGADTRYLSPAPLYHAAPIAYTLSTLWLGGTAVVMTKFDAATALQLVADHGITHVQFVPTHLVRLMRLPEGVRRSYDLSSLKYVITAAAPCPAELKSAVTSWIGPKMYEYYGGSETLGLCAIGPEETVLHPGSVGRSLMGKVHVLDPEGKELPAGEIGQLWFEGSQPFEYIDDPDKTARAWNDRGLASYGDIGYVNRDGYVYLTDRVGEVINSGGANVYPQEVEAALMGCPVVRDVAVLGMPDQEFGQIVTAFVQLQSCVDGDGNTRSELEEFARTCLTGHKRPKRYVFVYDLPRTDAGKMQRHKLRATFPTLPAP